MNFQYQGTFPGPRLSRPPRGSQPIMSPFGWAVRAPDGRVFIPEINNMAPHQRPPFQMGLGWPPIMPSQQGRPPFPGQQAWPTRPTGGNPLSGQVPGQFITPPLNDGGGYTRTPGQGSRMRLRVNPVRVKPSDLKVDAPECPICYRDYYTADAQNESEDAVQISCGHIHGRRCLDKWIQDHDTCPTCRASLDLVEDRSGGR